MSRRAGWSFVTTHARVLAAVADMPAARIRDIALTTGITERAAHRILADLERAGFLTRRRVGRRNHYTVHPERGRSHPAETGLPVPALLALIRRTTRP
ncbi:helix-turn-helix transcriptional regulator [Streptomyces sp. NPDC001046]|uniref:helix-turn-helix transcriptional regulator n=1 Tax=unclassified Streptomyces TaxID=2593676 RepID=UPI0035E16BE6